MLHFILFISLWSTILVKCFQCSELSPCWRKIVFEIVPALFALLTEQGAEAVEVGHEGLDRQLGVDGGLEVQHGSIRILGYSLEYLVPENENSIDFHHRPSYKISMT